MNPTMIALLPAGSMSAYFANNGIMWGVAGETDRADEELVSTLNLLRLAAKTAPSLQVADLDNAADKLAAHLQGVRVPDSCAGAAGAGVTQ